MMLPIVCKYQESQWRDINREKGEFAVGLTFVYKNVAQQSEFETLKLKEQLAEITDEDLKVIQ